MSKKVQRKKFLKDFTETNKCHDIGTYRRAASLWRMIIGEKTLDFNHVIMDAVFRPQDYVGPTKNSKVSAQRLVHFYMQRGDYFRSLKVFRWAYNTYQLKYPFLWRTGFSLLSRLGNHTEMKAFFQTMLSIRVEDQSAMVLEYLRYLSKDRHYEEICQVFDSLPCSTVSTEEVHTEREKSQTMLQVRLTAAQAFYQVWSADMSCQEAADMAEMHFPAVRELVELRGEQEHHQNSMSADAHVLSYSLMMLKQARYKEAFELLQWYAAKCFSNANSHKMLLQFIYNHHGSLQLPDSDPTFLDIHKAYLRCVPLQISASDSASACVFENTVTAMLERTENGVDELDDALVLLMLPVLDCPGWSLETWPWTVLIRCLGNIQPSMSQQLRTSLEQRQGVWASFRDTATCSTAFREVTRLVRGLLRPDIDLQDPARR